MKATWKDHSFSRFGIISFRQDEITECQNDYYWKKKKKKEKFQVAKYFIDLKNIDKRA